MLSTDLPKRVTQFARKYGYTPNEPFYYKLDSPVMTPEEISEAAMITNEMLFDLRDIVNRPKSARPDLIRIALENLQQSYNDIQINYYDNCIWLALVRKGDKPAQRDVANNVFTAMSLTFTQMCVTLARMKFLHMISTENGRRKFMTDFKIDDEIQQKEDAAQASLF